MDLHQNHPSHGLALQESSHSYQASEYSSEIPEGWFRLQYFFRTGYNQIEETTVYKSNMCTI